MKRRLITFKVTDSMIKQMNDMMSMGNYESRSELVRDSLAEFLGKEYYESAQAENEKLREKEQLNKT